MKKISLKIDRQILQALIDVSRSHINHATGDAIYDIFIKETLTDLLLRFAKYRHRSAKPFKINFQLFEVIAIREITDRHRQILPNCFELIMLDEYFFHPLLKLL